MAWEQIPGGLRQVSCADSAHIWGVNSGGHVWERTDDKWTNVTGATLSGISSGFDGTVCGVDSSGNVYKYAGDNQWTKLPGNLVQISVADIRRVWGVDSSGTVYHRARPDDAAPDVWSWVKVGGATLTGVSVGSDGAVWGVTSTGAVCHYLGADQWEIAPGAPALTQLSVGDAARVWGVDASGNVYKIGKPAAATSPWPPTFEQVAGQTLKQVSVGDDGRIWGVDGSDRIWRLPATLSDVLAASPELKQGSSVLSRAEWFTLQGFVAYSIYENPATDDKMRAKIGYGATDTLDDAMTQTVKLYATLKDNCVTFDNEIKPGTVDLANDIVQYQRIADTVYDRLGQAIDAYDIAGVETAKITDKLKALADEWAKDTPSEAAKDVKDRFKAYVERLYTEANTRSMRATALNDKLTAFSKSLSQSQADFTQMRDVTLKGKYDAEDEEVKKAKQNVKDKQAELDAMQKKKDDETIVLETAPLYLLIPMAGPIIMAGVLIGVGVDFAKTKEEVEGLRAQLEKLVAAQAAHQKFLGGIDTAKGLTDKTANDIKTVQPLVAKLAGAWNALASDLASLVKPNEGVLTKAKLEAKDEDWLMSSLDLGTARETWKDLKDAADKYRQFAFLTPWN